MSRFILKRLNSTETVTLEAGQTYNCGRDKVNNQIVCNSLIVSRMHCIFTASANGITIADKKSGNGVYVNYCRLTSQTPRDLKLDDIIGLGVPGNHEIKPNEHYVYRLQQWNESETDANAESSRKRASESVTDPIALKKIKTEEIVIDDDDELEVINIDLEPSVPGCAALVVPEVPRENPDHEKPQETPAARPPVPISNVVANGQTHSSAGPSSSCNGTLFPQKPAEHGQVLIKYEYEMEEVFIPPSPEYESTAGPSSDNNVTVQEEHLPTSYSADNIVELRTDVNDVFPSSQLFDQDDTANNGDVNCKMETDQDLFCSDEEEPPLIILSDEEEEGYDVGINNRWLDRIMSSQLVLQSIKKEPQVSAAPDVEDSDEAMENAAEVETDLPNVEKDLPDTEVDDSSEKMNLPDGEMEFPEEETEFSEMEMDYSAEPGYLSEGEIESVSKIAVKSASKPIAAQPAARSAAQKLTDHPVKIKIKIKKQKKEKKKKLHRSEEKSIEKKRKKANSRQEKQSSKDERDAVNIESPPPPSPDVDEEEPPPPVPSTSISSSALQSLEAIKRRSADLRIPIVRLSAKDIKKIQRIAPPHMPRGERHGVSCTVVSSVEPQAALAAKRSAAPATKRSTAPAVKPSTASSVKPSIASSVRPSAASSTTRTSIGSSARPSTGSSARSSIGSSAGTSARPSTESLAGPSAKLSIGSSTRPSAGPSQSSNRPDALAEIDIFSTTKLVSRTAHNNEDSETRTARKLERLKYKFSNAQPKARRPSFVSSQEKKQIREDRKERLKQIADEKSKKNNNDQPSVKRVNKPRAKITQKTRGDFLVPDIAEVQNEPEPKPEPESKAKNVDKLPRKIIQIPALPIPPKKSKIQRKEEPIVPAPADIPSVKPTAESDGQDAFIPLIDRSSNQKENEEPIAVFRPKKKVTFNDNVRVREFDIDPGNTMTKCKGKDKMMGQFPNAFNVANIPRLEEFLNCVLHWRPSWLVEQRTMTTDPPVVGANALCPLLTTYSSYEDYYKIMSPLLALELWHRVSTDYEERHRNQKHFTVFASIIPNSATRVSVPGKDIVLTSFGLYVLVNKRDAQRCLYPRFGDLVIMGLPSQQKANDDKPMELFAYISAIHSTYETKAIRYNPGLLQYVSDPYIVLSYTVTTKLLNVEISTNSILRIKTVSYLRSNMRTVQALQSLPMSPLLKPILKPNLESYLLPQVGDYAAYQFITGDNLNPRQTEVVLQIARTVVQETPKICLIQGPPGTGKSKVIVNIISEILYGENHYQSQKERRILVCAPSNAAIDEIAIRLLAIRSNLPVENRFKMVRIGRTDSMNEAVKRISLVELTSREIKKAMGEHEKLESIELEISSLLARINTVKIEIECPSVSANRKTTLMRKLECMAAKYTALTAAQNSRNQDPRQMERYRRQTEEKLIMGADIITCTLSSCYTNHMESIFGINKAKINVCIVDEATQTTEAETLIPLMLGVSTFVLVGDPKQLPATVLSMEAKRYGMDQSLFARLQNVFDGHSRNPVTILDTQYRMAYPIAFWPNKYFYDNRLKNSVRMLPLPFHFYKVLNLASVQDQTRKFFNTDEATFVANMIYTMLMHTNLEKLDSPLKIGIITPYNDQRTLINAKLKERLAQVPEKIRQKAVTEVNTVDSFQGQERDVIVMSCVRSSGIGFLSDPQRVCVALTRAKHTLIICGNFKTFERDQMWNGLLSDAKNRRVFMNVDYKASPEQIKRYVIRT